MVLRMVRSRSPGVDGQKVFDLPAWVPSRIIRALAADTGSGAISRAGCVGLPYMPQGVEHRHDTGEGCSMPLVEPIGVPNNGDQPGR